MRALQILLFIPLILADSFEGNHIVKESSASASSSSAGADAPPPPPPVPAPVPPVPLPGGAFFPGAGFSKGLGLKSSLDLNVGGGAGAGVSPFAGLFPGLFGGVPPAVPGAVPPFATGDPAAFDPAAGGLPVAGPGYLGTPFPFLGPSYVPYSWLGSALGAKGDLLFPVVIFLFVVVGIWTVVQFLLGLVVPLIAAKFDAGESIIKAKTMGMGMNNGPPMMNGRHFRSLEQQHEDRLNSVTQAVMDALERTNQLHHQHDFGIPETLANNAPNAQQAQTQAQNLTGQANATEQHKHPLFSAFA